jgi:hypothetical protein
MLADSIADEPARTEGGQETAGSSRSNRSSRSKRSRLARPIQLCALCDEKEFGYLTADQP